MGFHALASRPPGLQIGAQGDMILAATVSLPDIPESDSFGVDCHPSIFALIQQVDPQGNEIFSRFLPARDTSQRLALALESEWRHLLVRHGSSGSNLAARWLRWFFADFDPGTNKLRHVTYFGGVTRHSASASPPAIASGFTRGPDFLANALRSTHGAIKSTPACRSS